MTKRREPDSRAVAEARSELREIVAELRGTKARAMAVSRRLNRAAKTAAVVATHPTDGDVYTAETWMADEIKSSIGDDLDVAIMFLAAVARVDARPVIRGFVAREDERGRIIAARKGQVVL